MVVINATFHHFNDIFSGTYGNSTSTPLSQSHYVKNNNKKSKFWISNYNRLSLVRTLKNHQMCKYYSEFILANQGPWPLKNLPCLGAYCIWDKTKFIGRFPVW